jgi:hypothetical protein
LHVSWSWGKGRNGNSVKKKARWASVVVGEHSVAERELRHVELVPASGWRDPRPSAPESLGGRSMWAWLEELRGRRASRGRGEDGGGLLGTWVRVPWSCSQPPVGCRKSTSTPDSPRHCAPRPAPRRRVGIAVGAVAAVPGASALCVRRGSVCRATFGRCARPGRRTGVAW